MKKNYFELFQSITTLIYDFDGVMTDNTFFQDSDGKETVKLNRSDGYAIRILKEKGLNQFILSSEENNVVKKRAEKIDIPAFTGILDKACKLEALAIECGFLLDATAYIGNDVNDLEAMKLCKLCLAPSDSNKDILEIADIKLKSKGGEGVIREVLELIYPKETSLN